MSEKRSLTLGTAGHIDHGKSALVQALTGTDPDRLLEEKRRGITIEIGFAELLLPDETTLSIVDVPGHERFIRQMISGATGIDMALLCIAADDGVMPQTTEHLAILQLLGIKSCLVALTKADLVDEDWLAFVTEEVRQRLVDTPYSDAPILANSSKTGAGLPELKAAIAAMAKRHQRQSRGAVFRLPVDRAFSIKGSGTVVTGTLWSGSVSVGDEVSILPGDRISRVRGIQIHGAPQERAHAGNRVALNLNAVTVEQVRPGSFLVAPGSLVSTDRFDAFFTYHSLQKSDKPLKSGQKIRLAHGTQEVFGRLLLMDVRQGDEQSDASSSHGASAHGDGSRELFSLKTTHENRPHELSLLPGQKAWVQIRLDEPLTVARNDRFIVRLRSPQVLLGGGTVLFSHPRRRTVLSEGEKAFLQALEGRDNKQIIATAVALRTTPFNAEELSIALEIAPETTSSELSSLVDQGTLSMMGKAPNNQWFIPSAVLKRLLQKLENLLVAFHSDNPELPGMTKAALMQRFQKSMDASAFDALLDRAEQEDLLFETKGIISHSSSRSRITELDEQVSLTLLALLQKASVAPPTIEALVVESKLDASIARRVLASMEDAGKLVRVGRDFYYDKQAYDSLLQSVISFLEKQGEASAADLKTVMGLSRKHAIPLLEHFDACLITKRRGDLRVLAAQPGHEPA